MMAARAELCGILVLSVCRGNHNGLLCERESKNVLHVATELHFL